MKKVRVEFTRGPTDSEPVGDLAEDGGRVYFEYDPRFLETGLDLSPFHLPRQAGLIEHADRDFGPLPGLFDDSLPDGWGLLLMDRHFRSLGPNPARMSPLDRLSWLGTGTMGALTYHPPTERELVDATLLDLHDLARHSRDILAGSATAVLPQLLRAGSSPGGARPKVLVGFDPTSGRVISGVDELPDRFEPWLVKFPAREDTGETGAIEYAYARMAAAAGIDLPPTRLFQTDAGDRFFGARRFDRQGGRRFHMHTFGNLLQADFRIPSLDYADLLKATSLLTRHHRDVLRVFRRMVFNVLAHNRDDHAKNFAFLLDDLAGTWSLSPAYDLLHTPGPGGEHSLALAGEGRHPGRSHMLELAGQAGIRANRAEDVIEEVALAVSRWPEFAAAAGVTPAAAARIANVLRQIRS